MQYMFDPRFLELPVHHEMPDISMTAAQQAKLNELIAFIWPEQDLTALKTQLLELVAETYKRLSAERPTRQNGDSSKSLWSEKQIVLICYGDHIRSRNPQKTPLQALGEFCRAQFHEDEFSQLTIHLLPIYPSPYKDGGFDIADPFAVNPNMGAWEDVRAICRHFRVAVDFVANHLSIASDWFQRYMQDDSQYKDFFIGFDDEAAVRRLEKKALPNIYRPRPHNPFIPLQKPDGSMRWVYMTFSDHQADVNYENPFVFLKMTETLLFYVLQGAEMIRLDAIPYLWKEWSTPCAHHPKTHALVELMRLTVNLVNPNVKLLAESMEPLADSMRYLSTADKQKAHLAYNFAPCGLIPHSLLSEDASVFQRTLLHFLPPHQGVNWAVVCGVTHDGSSVNPCRAPKSVQGESLLNEAQIQAIGDYYTAHGYQELERRCKLSPEHADHLRADFQEVFSERHYEQPRFINYKSITDEQGQPQKIVYEAISTYASIFDQQPDKIVAAMAMALTLPGIPFVYLTLPFALLNDFNYYLETGNPRELNRGRVFLEDVLRNLLDKETLTYKVFSQYKEFLRLRALQPAFHPDAPITPVTVENTAILAFLRESLDHTQRVFVVQNVSAQEQQLEVDLSRHIQNDDKTCVDLISGQSFALRNAHLPLTLAPYRLRWIEL
ncbi:alpha amylase catalytic region [Candidatus Vecturithrix granuli]|uniref:Alpha amylase catalytic region n=1 Tax=Vecturithrix granuli TaxID=1499967 RepID=A0A081C3G3_VECG1|nr:alpha amylase catalytic region [Candidatus Vecturithrix granuli]